MHNQDITKAAVGIDIRNGKELDKMDRQLEGMKAAGYEYEILACKKALLNGDIECPEMPHSETLAVMKLMDSIRETWEMTFPCEKEYYRV